MLLGVGVTAVIQSSSVTSIMTIGFVNSGMMKFRQAVSIILGSILGTSITGWIVCLSAIQGAGGWVALLSTATITGIVAIIGIYLRKFTQSQVKNQVGEILMGFAILMYGMTAITNAVKPFCETDSFLNFLSAMANPLIGILVGMIEMESDNFDTHNYLSGLKKLQDATFNRYYEEYQNKYSI